MTKNNSSEKNNGSEDDAVVQQVVENIAAQPLRPQPPLVTLQMPPPLAGVIYEALHSLLGTTRGSQAVAAVSSALAVVEQGVNEFNNQQGAPVAPVAPIPTPDPEPAASPAPVKQE